MVEHCSDRSIGLRELPLLCIKPWGQLNWPHWRARERKGETTHNFAARVRCSHSGTMRTHRKATYVGSHEAMKHEAGTRMRLGEGPLHHPWGDGRENQRIGS